MPRTGNVIKGGRPRPKSRLQARQASYAPDPKYQGARTMPGSTNSHKSWPR